jgi:hypothetical protein
MRILRFKVLMKIMVIWDMICCIVLLYVPNYSVSHPRGLYFIHGLYLYEYVMGPCKRWPWG